LSKSEIFTILWEPDFDHHPDLLIRLHIGFTSPKLGSDNSSFHGENNELSIEAKEQFDRKS